MRQWTARHCAGASGERATRKGFAGRERSRGGRSRRAPEHAPEHADPDRGPVAYAIGFVIGALGAKARGTPLTPWLSEIPIVERWQALERKVFDAAKTRAAAEAAARRIDTAIASARDRITSVPTTTTGVASA